jgi:curved DNA-binding protein CbpA
VRHSDHYLALGVPPDADPVTIRAAYLRVMREHHPDHRPGDAAALERARAANAAWEVLGHSARRASYDRLRAPTGGAARSAVAHVAYSPERRRYRTALTAAMIRIAAGVVAAGAGILAVLG